MISDWIIDKNNQYIIFNKPSGIPVQKDKTGDLSLLEMGMSYLKTHLFPVNRIDRPASGIVIMAKTHKAVVELNAQFKLKRVSKTYLAVVAEKPIEEEQTISMYLKKNTKSNKTVVSLEPTEDAKRANMTYKYLKSIDRYHLLEIKMDTGRHHQIRAILGKIGLPIKGDVKYGARRPNKDRSIHLHAWKIEFYHPITNEKLELTAPLPDETIWNAFG
jgi:23S rRNA pseudouridine1911/1915/1917 synthase